MDVLDVRIDDENTAHRSFFPLVFHVKTKIFLTLHKHPGGLSCFFVFVLAQSHFPFSKEEIPSGRRITGCLHFQASEKMTVFFFFLMYLIHLPPSLWGTV